MRGLTMVKRRPRRRNPEAIQFARDQRATANEFARHVWHMVRNRGCCGEKFRREHVIGPYTVDFCCIALKLVAEVDGEHHFTDDGKEHDRKRDAYLNELGYKVLRIPGFEVLNDPSAVRKRIEWVIKSKKTVTHY